jgi:antitoxin (DNA-binding transcriptional repressor) of toxin-antitoxin stability system
MRNGLSPMPDQKGPEMERIETSKLNRGLKEVLDRVKMGETLILTRYGKDVARLSPLSEGGISVKPVEPLHFEEKDILPDPKDKFTIVGSPPKSAQSARDALLNKIRTK